MPRLSVRPRGARSSQSATDEELSADDEPSTVQDQSTESSEDDDGDSENEGDAKKRKGGGRRGGSKKPPKPKKIMPHAGVTLSLNEMVHNALLYFLLMQHRKLPVKRSEIVKHAMNMQNKSLPEVIARLDQVFSDIFGIRVVGLEESTSQRTKTCSSYTLISKYSLSMSELVTDRPIEVQCKRSCLFLILTLIFMLNRPVEEENIWTTLESLGFDAMVCKKAEDLKRFLRTEYVSNMYLHAEEISENDRTVRRYSWGPRADLEFSKYAVLKFAARQFPGKKPSDFAQQYLRAKEQECEVVEADEAESAAQQSVDPEDEGVLRSITNRSNSSHELIGDATEVEDDPEQVDLDIETDTEN